MWHGHDLKQIFFLKQITKYAIQIADSVGVRGGSVVRYLLVFLEVDKVASPYCLPACRVSELDVNKEQNDILLHRVEHPLPVQKLAFDAL